MQFELTKSKEILSRTPTTLMSMLEGLSDEWLLNNEGENTWSPFDVVGHLVHGEKTDWITRTTIILSDLKNKTFEPFHRFAQLRDSQGKTMRELLTEFRVLREKNLNELDKFKIEAKDLDKTGMHPGLGEVTLRHLLSAWTVHDLGHLAQISRVMAKQYLTEVGPWTAYMGVLKG